MAAKQQYTPPCVHTFIVYIPLLLSTTLLLSCGSKTESSRQTNCNDPLVSQLREQYNSARILQRKGKYDDAIRTFKTCLAVTADKQAVCDSLLPIMVDVMVQLMNTYQSKGEPEACVVCLDSVRRHPSAFIHDYCMRDLDVINAYALSRTDRTEEAERLADSALAIPLYHPTPERLFRDYAYTAAISFGNPDRQELVIERCRMALEQARFCKNSSGAQYVTSMLGLLYRRRGQLSEAINLYLESCKLAQEKGDAPGEATSCNSLAELYLYWDIPTYANHYASQAIALNGEHPGSNPMIAIQSLLLKGQIMMEMEYPDSTLHYYHRAESISRSLPYTCGQADVDFLNDAFRIEHCMGDSLQEGMKNLRHVIAEGTPLLRAKAYYKLAEGYFKQQQKAKAEALLDSMYQLLHSFNPPQYIEVNYEWVLKHYLEQKDLPHVEQYVLDLIEECKFNFNSDICTKMYDNIVDLQTKEEKQQLLIQQMKLDNDRLYYRIWIFTTMLTLLLLATWMVYRRNLSRLKNQLLVMRLSTLMDNLEEAQREKNRTKQELSEITRDKEKAEQELSDLLADKETRKQIKALAPSILHDEGEDNFRQRFERMYPHFLPALREKVPAIGRKEELLCMLIALGQDTHQTAILMGIAYKSTNMARYRLRQKLDLNTNDSLDDFIRTMIEEQSSSRTNVEQ